MKKFIQFSVIALFLSFSISAMSNNKAEPNAAAEPNVANVITTELSGVVFDKKTNESLAGVIVLVNGQKIYTDLEGQFTVRNLCIGVCEIKVSLISYEEKTIKVDTSKQNNLRVALSQR